MADYLATALVRVRPDTKGFAADLRAQAKKSVAGLGTLKVPVRAELKAFKQQVNRELKANPIKIPVVPDMTGFQAELRRRVTASARGVSAKIKVEAAGGLDAKIVDPGDKGHSSSSGHQSAREHQRKLSGQMLSGT